MNLKEKITKLKEYTGNEIEKMDSKSAYNLACDELLSFIEDLIEQVKELPDYYPDDVFKPLSKTEIKKAQKALEKFGISVDGYSAHLMKIARKNAINNFIELLNGLLTHCSKKVEKEGAVK